MQHVAGKDIELWKAVGDVRIWCDDDVLGECMNKAIVKILIMPSS